MTEKPDVYLNYLDSPIELMDRRQNLLLATELKFFKEKAEAQALIIDTMVEALKQGKTVRFQGMDIIQKKIAEIVSAAA